jgi:N-acyl-L-homoserine lactone synthetase
MNQGHLKARVSVDPHGEESDVSRTDGYPGARFLALLSRLEYRRAISPEDRESIYALRYRAYLGEGAIEPRSDRRLHDEFDEDPNSWIFGLHLEGTLVGSIRICLATPERPVSPAMHCFGDLLEDELARGHRIIDPNRFVADPDLARKIPGLPYMMVRLAIVAVQHFGAAVATATVRREHQAFYRKVFGAQPLCPPRPYPTLTKPLSLMISRFPESNGLLLQRYPFMAARAGEAEALYGPGRADAAKLLP